MVEYRAATYADMPALIDMISQLDQQHQQYGAPRSAESNIALLEYALQHDQYNPIAISDGRIIGWSGYCHVPGLANDEVMAIGTYVDPLYRNQNISSTLRQMAFDHYKQLGYHTITGTVNINNDAGLQSALKVGYTIIGYIVQYKL